MQLDSLDLFKYHMVHAKWKGVIIYVKNKVMQDNTKHILMCIVTIQCILLYCDCKDEELCIAII